MYSPVKIITIVFCSSDCTCTFDAPDHIKPTLLFYKYNQNSKLFRSNIQALNDDLIVKLLHVFDKSRPTSGTKTEILDFKIVWITDAPQLDSMILAYQLHKSINEFSRKNVYCRVVWDIITTSGEACFGSDFEVLARIISPRIHNSISSAYLWNYWLLWKGTVYWNHSIHSSNTLKYMHGARLYSNHLNLEKYSSLIKSIILSPELYFYRSILVNDLPTHKMGISELSFTLSLHHSKTCDLHLDSHCWLGYFCHKKHDTDLIERTSVVLLSSSLHKASNDGMYIDIPIRILGNMDRISDESTIMHHITNASYELHKSFADWCNPVRMELGYLSRSINTHSYGDTITRIENSISDPSLVSTVSHQPLDNPFISNSLPVKKCEYEKAALASHEVPKKSRTRLRRRSLVDELVIPQEHSVHNINKTKLKRCILLSLKRHKIDICHHEFTEVCKSLYNNVCFAFRKEFKIRLLSEAQFFSVIDSNINSLNIK